MRYFTMSLALAGLLALPARAQDPVPLPTQATPPVQVAPAAPVMPAAPRCECAPVVSQVAPVRRTYRPATYRRRSAPPGGSTTRTTAIPPFDFSTTYAYAPLTPVVRYAQFNTSGGWAGLGPNGTGLEDGSINDGIMGGPAGGGGAGPDNIGW